MSHNEQIGKLQAALMELLENTEKLEVKAKSGPDNSFTRIMLLGLPGMSFEQRIEHMSKLMTDKFPGIKCTCSVYFRKGDANNDRAMTNTGFAESGSSAVRDAVLKQIDKNGANFKFAIEART